MRIETLVWKLVLLARSVDWERTARISSGLLTPLIAIVAAWIAYQQYAINHRQHRLALFEKRMIVFNATMDLVASILKDAKVELAQLFEFIHKTRDHDFLFGPEIGTYIDDIYKRGLELNTRDFANKPEDISKRYELLSSFSGEIARGTAKFLKYMDFTNP